MVLTQRDIGILAFLNDFGVVSREIISELFYYGRIDKRKLAEKRLRKLYYEGYILRDHRAKKGSYAYALARKAAKLLMQKGIFTYETFSKIDSKRLDHDYLLHKAVIEFHRNGITDILSERKLLSDGSNEDLMPDFVACLDHDYRVAVEIERSKKSKIRVMQKLRKYDRTKEFEVIMYLTFNHNSIRTTLDSCYKQLDDPYFQLVNITGDEFFKDSSIIIRPLIDTSKGAF